MKQLVLRYQYPNWVQINFEIEITDWHRLYQRWGKLAQITLVWYCLHHIHICQGLPETYTVGRVIIEFC